MVEHQSDKLGDVGSNPTVTTMKQEILDAGWKYYQSPYLAEKYREGVYEKGNYWMKINEDSRDITVIAQDPVKLLDEGWVYPENFKLCVPYKGPKTLEGLDKLLDL